MNGGGAWGLKAAIDYINSIGFPAIEAKENALTAFAMEEMKKFRICTSLEVRNQKNIMEF